MRLGSISFINSLPVDLGMTKRAVPAQADLVEGSPAQLNEWIRRGKLDVSPVSVMEYGLRQRDYLALPGLSISSRSGVGSVLLFSRYPLAELADRRILVTPKGRTTPALLEILCRLRHGFRPNCEVSEKSISEAFTEADAMLLIGDEALEANERLKDSGLYVIDLAQVWSEWTQHPLVFAIWVVRREIFEVAPEEIKRLHEAILASKDWGLKHLDEVLIFASERTQLPGAVLKQYFSKLSYEFGCDLKEGMRIFFEKAVQCGLLELVGEFEEIGNRRVAAARHKASAGPSKNRRRFVDGSAAIFGGDPTIVGDILDKALQGGRVTVEEGFRLYHEADLFELGSAANELCIQKNPEAKYRATFVVDRNINYTNFCYTLCKFCAFYRRPGDTKEGYLRTREEIFHKIDELVAIGGTQVLLQGGHNPDLGIDYYEDLTRAIRRRYPGVHIHSYSASEVVHISKVSRISVREVLRRLKEAGLNSLPGGGAEILVDRVRKIVSPLKTKVSEYFEVHRTAHEIGLKSTATMVYGLGETVEERMLHLDGYRRLQDETHGFRAFIPWSFESEATEMVMPRQTGAEYLRMIALSRIMLDNIPHLQAGWVTEGPKLSQVALLYGADDFGGILMEENVVSATKSARLYSGVTKEEAIRLISEVGKIPAQRNTNYEVVRIFSQELTPRVYAIDLSHSIY